MPWLEAALGDSRTRIVFDLDDTLYLERDFVRSGFRALGTWLAGERGVTGFFEATWDLFEQGRRGDVFDVALGRLGVEPERELIGELVERYRAHPPTIRLAPDAARFLSRLPSDRPLGLITDGPAVMQRNKLEALGLAERFAAPLLTGDWGSAFSKPHPRAFEEMERRLGAEGGELIYIADNPKKDFEQPRARGWRTIRMRRKKGLYAAEAGIEAEREVTNFDELMA